MKYFYLLIGLLICITARAAENEFSFKPRADLDSGSYRGRAVLAVPKTRILRAEPFKVDIRFINKSGGGYFYNPYLNSLVTKPAVVAVFNSKKQYVGDLLEWSRTDENGMTTIVSRRSPELDDWVYIASLAYAGKEQQVKTQYGWAFKRPGRALPAGTYYLQAIFNSAFIWRRPQPSQNTMRLNNQKIQKDLFRSNVVMIHVTDRK